MKKIINTALVLSLFTLGSCENWLKLEPVGSKTTGNYIKDYASGVAAYNGIHEVLLNLYSGDYQTLLEALSDDAFVPTHVDGSTYKAFDQLQISEGSGSNYYGTLYTGISRANVALVALDRLSDSKDRERIDALKGQVLFMRAYFYFTLLKLYGEVPVMPVVESLEKAKQPRADFQYLYTIIEKDFKDASSLMPETLDNSLGLEYGKPYKYVAQAALADFYLYFEKWTEARIYTDSIMSSGHFEKIAYTAVFNQENEALGLTYSNTYNKEVLWDAYYADEKKQGFTWRITPQGRNIYREGYGLSALYCTQNDLLAHNNEANIMPYKGKNGGLGIMDEFEEGDKRLEQLFWTDTIVAPNTSGYTGCIKYDGLSYADHSTVNYPLYRYSEVLLMRAEAENELDELTLAKQIIDDEIRKPAGLAPTLAEDKAALRDAIFAERRLELAFEAKRFFDLNRRGLAAKYIEEKQISIAEGGLSKHEITNPMTGKKHFVFSLPLGEINTNPFIEENNPGY